MATSKVNTSMRCPDCGGRRRRLRRYNPDPEDFTDEQIYMLDLHPTHKESLPQQWQDFIREANEIAYRAAVYQGGKGYHIDLSSIISFEKPPSTQYSSRPKKISKKKWNKMSLMEQSYAGRVPFEPTVVNKTVAERILSIAQQTNELAEKAILLSLPMPKAFYGQPDVTKVFEDTKENYKICLDASRAITAHIVGGERPSGWTYSLHDRSRIDLGEELGRIEKHLPLLAKNLPLLYAAAGLYTVSFTPVAKIGPIDVYLEEVEGILPDDLVDQGVKFMIKVIKLIYTKYRDLGIPDYALKGPIFLQVGLPPVTHGGLYRSGGSRIDVTLFSKSYLKKELRSPKAKAAEYAHTVAHELAHRIYFVGLTPRARQSWKDIYDTTTLSEDQFLYLRALGLVVDYRDILSGSDRPTFTGLESKPDWKIKEIKNTLTEEEIETCNFIFANWKSELAPPEVLEYLVTRSQTEGFWPTLYSRTDEKEAFADTLAYELLPLPWHTNTPEASNLIRNILKGVRIHKPRRKLLN